jgi:hypothetical protein
MYCSNCGTALDTTQEDCPKCGQKPPSPPSPQKSSFGKIFGIIATFIVLFGLGKLLFSENPSEIVENQLAAIRNHQLTEAYYSYSSKEFQAATSLETFKEFVKDIPALSQNESFTLTSKTLDKEQGILVGVLHGKEQTKAEVEYSIIKEEGKWKILSIRLQDPASRSPESVDPEIMTPVTSQLQALREKNLSKSYQENFSEEFKAKTPLERYEEFINSYPILTAFSTADLSTESSKDHQGTASVILDSSSSHIPIEYKLIKEKDQWKIWSMRVILPLNEGVSAPLTDPNALIPIVKEQLKAISQNQIEEAYHHFSSKNFKETTSLEAFHTFVDQFKLLKEHQSVEILSSEIENNFGKLEAKLTSLSETNSFNYSLILEEGQWKVLGIEIVEKLSSQNSAGVPEFNSQELLSVIDELFKAFKKGDLLKAYENYTSTDFRKETPFETFKEFLQTHAILTLYDHYTFDNLTFNNNMAIIKGTVSYQQIHLPIEFNLIPEENSWKVILIQFHDPATEKQGQIEEGMSEMK